MRLMINISVFYNVLIVSVGSEIISAINKLALEGGPMRGW